MFLRSVLAGAGLGYLLVRGNNDRPVIAVDWKDRKELRDALVEACRDEPFYSMSVDAKKKSVRAGGRRRALAQPPGPDLPAVPAHGWSPRAASNSAPPPASSWSCGASRATS